MIESAYECIKMTEAPRSRVPNTRLASVAMILVLAAIAIADHYGSPLLLPRADVTAVPDAGCDLRRQACAVMLPDGARIELSIAPRPIPILAPLRVEVAVTGLKAARVEVDFAGESMNMGYNRSKLAVTTPGRYSGEASLPVCVSGRMAWVATLIVETDGQRISVPFRFDAGH